MRGLAQAASTLLRTDLLLSVLTVLQSTQITPSVDSGNVELRAGVSSRVIERLLLPDRPRADWPVAIARAAGIVEYFEDLSVRGPDSFESRGVTAGVNIDLFSVPLNFSSVVLDVGYEFRDYHRLGRSDHFPRVALRTGFGPP